MQMLRPEDPASILIEQPNLRAFYPLVLIAKRMTHIQDHNFQ